MREKWAEVKWLRCSSSRTECDRVTCDQRPGRAVCRWLWHSRYNLGTRRSRRQTDRAADSCSHLHSDNQAIPPTQALANISLRCNASSNFTGSCETENRERENFICHKHVSNTMQNWNYTSQVAGCQNRHKPNKLADLCKKTQNTKNKYTYMHLVHRHAN